MFDLFIDIESTHEFSDLFFQIFMIYSEKSGPVKVEGPVIISLLNLESISQIYAPGPVTNGSHQGGHEESGD